MGTVLAEATTTMTGIDELLRYGVLGVVVVLLLLGFLWAKPPVDRLIQDNDKVSAQRDALIEMYEKEILPAMANATAMVARSTTVIEKNSTVIESVQPLLARVEAKLDLFDGRRGVAP